MNYKGIFVDDVEEIYAALLSVSGSEKDTLSIQYRPLAEAATLAGELFNERPDIVLLDFRLDENPKMIDPQKSYNGSGLAQLLRDKSSVAPEYDFPIVLISGEDKLESFYRPDGTAHDLFDRIYQKGQVGENPDPVKNELISLCEGYRQIKEFWADKSKRLSMLNIEAEEIELIVNQELRVALSSAGAPHIAARTILKCLIDRSGILLSDNEVAARLGTESLAPLEPELLHRKIRYDGVFNLGWRRWWAHRLDDWSKEVFNTRPTNITGSERVKLLNAKFGLNLSPAVSTWNNSSDEKFAFSCAVCERISEIRHSVSAFDPHAPKYSHRKRICWDCIQTERHLQKKIDVDDVDANLAREVLTKQRNGESSL
ncbi:MAG: hypothetical protein A0129_10410 [Limnobacter sp. CACIAM 66H1]|uniref:hypothetical protein n=1 Tax=Limnobacter sp. CACIAM 66H1 TaxID=1813033 RepID=UPI0007A7EB2D|nr:hypothetical protein [Limnobacter sp. CACIAM 66H1]KYP10903.1 MAG: hypothetical protein A0129_10410 [Limnobacter sp. CACIAM 66H1]